MREMLDTKIAYGCEEFGRLTLAMMHRPGSELELINPKNHRQWLFDQVPDIGQFIDEHDRYRQLLISHGVEVLELSDYVNEHHEFMQRMPNLTYLHDTAVICSRGAILSSMAWPSRKGEESVMHEALRNLGIPIFIEFDSKQDSFEGCLLLSPDTVLVAETERHRRATIDEFVRKALTAFREVIYVDIPKARRYMHPDTVYNRVSQNLAITYLPVFKTSYLITSKGIEKIDFLKHMERKGVELINVSDSEQRRLACSFVPLEPGVIFHYDTALNKETQILLARKGVEVIFFHPEALYAGGGSLRCLTLRLRREPLSSVL
jgi:arginine deiminase